MSYTIAACVARGFVREYKSGETFKTMRTLVLAVSALAHTGHYLSSLGLLFLGFCPERACESGDVLRTRFTESGSRVDAGRGGRAPAAAQRAAAHSH